jgi:hypothetical protein
MTTVAQLVWACRERTCYLVQKPDGTYQSVWNASPEQLSQYTVIMNKHEQTPEDTSQWSLLSKIGPSPW